VPRYALCQRCQTWWVSVAILWWPCALEGAVQALEGSLVRGAVLQLEKPGYSHPGATRMVGEDDWVLGVGSAGCAHANGHAGSEGHRPRGTDPLACLAGVVQCLLVAVMGSPAHTTSHGGLHLVSKVGVVHDTLREVAKQRHIATVLDHHLRRGVEVLWAGDNCSGGVIPQRIKICCNGLVHDHLVALVGGQQGVLVGHGLLAPPP
jgi:hypothetical protein